MNELYLNGTGFDLDHHFRLDKKFLGNFKNKKPNFGFNGLGELVFYRTYSRIMPDGKKEAFIDTLTRVAEGCYEVQRRHCVRLHIPWDKKKAQRSAQEMFQRMWDFKFLPPGRGLWMMGTEFMWSRGSASLNNCAFVSTSGLSEADPAEPFCFLMDMSMLGVGVGFDTKGAGHIKIGKPANKAYTYVVDDDREGWVDSLRHLIASYTNGREDGHVEFDYSKIRPEGSLINGFGGKASGSRILVELHGMIREHLGRCVGKTLSSVDITDLMNYIGRCVVAGNVRRCLPKGTLVHLKRGLVPIEQVQVGDLVLTSDGYHPVTENVRQGVQNVVTVNSQLGQFRCTDRHRIAVMDGIGSYKWKRANQLKSGDRMVFVDAAIPGVETVLPGHGSFESRSLLIPVLDCSVAWFIGAIHGDGYVYRGRQYGTKKNHGAGLSIAINQDEYLDGINEKVLAGFDAFGFKPKVQNSSDNCQKLRVTSRKLAHYFGKHIKQSRKSINVPECIRLASVDIRGAYLAGLLDTDGPTKNRPTTLFTTVYRDFARQVQAVYSSLGIPTKLKLRKEADQQGQAKWDICLVGDFAIEKFKKFIQPHAVKQVRVMTHASSHDFGYPSEWVDRKSVKYGKFWTPQHGWVTHQRALLCGARISGILPVEVESVVDEGISVETYDLSVPDRSEFVAEGLLVHNTAEIAFGEADDPDYCNMKNPLRGLAPEEVSKFYACTSKIYAAGKGKGTLDDFTESGIPEDRLLPAIETWNALNYHRWASNNSIFAKVGMDYSSVGNQIAVNGEPGLMWLDNARNYGRFIDGKQPGIDGRVMGSNPCVEQSLESYELCCLVETFPAHHDDAEDYLRTLKFAYLYAKTVTLLPTHNLRTNQVMLRNRRIGLSQSGIVQAYAKFGRRKMLMSFSDAGYSEVRKWDYAYSEWFCVPKSIKVTSIKPSGTVSLLVGATPGIHHPEARTYWRRVRIAKDSVLIQILKDAGYHVEPAISDPDRTVVVKFAISEPNLTPVGQISIWQQMTDVVDYHRYWADNQVSATVKFKTEEKGEISKVLSAYEDQIKGVSFLPLSEHGYVQAPYEACTAEEVESYNSNLKSADYSAYIYEAIGSKGCDGEACEFNSAPAG